MQMEPRRRTGRLVLRQMLREMRKEAGLQQVALAERLGRPQSFVSDVEKGQRRVDILELMEICDACGVTLTDFASRLQERMLAGSKAPAD
ncbi:MAG TPA: helix-turn-helix transcriptional regulator [Longimicrobium sp.]|nr:helix-turn-helix transcriptional regulator [Longimicrobium sp.]